MKRILILISIILFCYLVLVIFSQNVGNLLVNIGIVPEQVSIAGTGSMYPTFPKSVANDEIVRAHDIVAWPKMKRFPAGFELFGRRFLSYEIRRGDIIEFENDKTREISLSKYGDTAGFVKRVIATPDDSVELRDGFVYLNGMLLDEPYTASPRSTYGGSTLADCKTLRIPDDKVFVLGDNRKASMDSRYELGLIDITSINYVLSRESQNEFSKNWRDTSSDEKLAHTSTLDPQTFIKLLNDKRKKDNLKNLAYNSLLSQSSKLRGEVMLESNDFSTEATISGLNLQNAVKKTGYRNIIFGELFTRGFYTASELLDNFLEFRETQKLLFSSEYQDIGISTVLGDVDKCPNQVVTVHLGGYVPPNYSKAELESWQKLIENIQKVLPSWESLRSSQLPDKDKLERLIVLLSTRLQNAQKIHNVMAENKWLTDEEEKIAQDDKRLSDEANALISELNK